jgi:SAM-dependent methyltransferase
MVEETPATDVTAATARRVTTADELIDSIWIASALATALDQSVLPKEDRAAAVLAVAGLVEREDTGWLPTEWLRADIAAGRTDVLRERLIATLGQAATIAARGAGCGWDSYSDEVLLAQARLSAAASRGVKAMLSSVPELKAVLDGCRVVIDAGVGVAGGACAICEAVPATRLIGLDVNPRALGLARETIAAKGLSDRIELRLQGVEELQDVGVASLAHIAAPFIPRPALIDGIPRVFRALQPGGMLLLSGVSTDDANGAISRWQAYNAGGVVMTLAECAALVTATGFEEPSTPSNLPAGSPLIAYCRRP